MYWLYPAPPTSRLKRRIAPEWVESFVTKCSGVGLSDLVHHDNPLYSLGHVLECTGYSFRLKFKEFRSYTGMYWLYPAPPPPIELDGTKIINNQANRIPNRLNSNSANQQNSKPTEFH